MVFTKNITYIVRSVITVNSFILFVLLHKLIVNLRVLWDSILLQALVEGSCNGGCRVDLHVLIESEDIFISVSVIC